MKRFIASKKQGKKNDLLQLAEIAYKFKGPAEPMDLSANYKRYLYGDKFKETVDILSDRELVRAIEAGERDFREGKYVTFEQLKKDLKLA